MRDLMREDERKRAEGRLEALLLQGLGSPASEWAHEDIDHIKNAIRERLAAKPSNGAS
jgi:hypothetical protein